MLLFKHYDWYINPCSPEHTSAVDRSRLLPPTATMKFALALLAVVGLSEAGCPYPSSRGQPHPWGAPLFHLPLPVLPPAPAPCPHHQQFPAPAPSPAPDPCPHRHQFPAPAPTAAAPNQLPSLSQLQSLLSSFGAASTTAAPVAVTSTTQAPTAGTPSLAELQALLNALGISLPAVTTQAPAVTTQAPVTVAPTTAASAGTPTDAQIQAFLNALG
ncbi:unnamed protein product [Nezara viridula]|uniref:Uncharacterized protein n=1 Tax=Nezara viridula TaxID=85310 RepID=A0A9P0HLP2_NEZVI|nr:unnamed protein product [Nezara viridula]